VIAGAQYQAESLSVETQHLLGSSSDSVQKFIFIGFDAFFILDQLFLISLKSNEETRPRETKKHKGTESARG